jgi:hypothetical protein
MFGDRWFGLRHSEAQKQHYNRQLATWHAGKEANFAHSVGTWLEFQTFARSLGTVGAQEYLLLHTDPNSLTSVFGGELLLDSCERLRLMAHEVNESYRNRALGTR